MVTVMDCLLPPVAAPRPSAMLRAQRIHLDFISGVHSVGQTK